MTVQSIAIDVTSSRQRPTVSVLLPALMVLFLRISGTEDKEIFDLGTQPTMTPSLNLPMTTLNPCHCSILNASAPEARNLYQNPVFFQWASPLSITLSNHHALTSLTKGNLTYHNPRSSYVIDHTDDKTELNSTREAINAVTNANSKGNQPRFILIQIKHQT